VVGFIAPKDIATALDTMKLKDMIQILANASVGKQASTAGERGRGSERERQRERQT